MYLSVSLTQQCEWVCDSVTQMTHGHNLLLSCILTYWHMYPLNFLDLPKHNTRIRETYTIISNSYNAALSLLQKESTDRLWLWIHTEQLLTQTIPLPESSRKGYTRWCLGDLSCNGSCQFDWQLEDITKLYSFYVSASLPFLSLSSFELIYRDPSAIRYPDFTYVGSLGNPGRPKIEIDKDWVKDVLSRSHNISLERLFQILKISQRTLRERIKEYGLGDIRFDPIADKELDDILWEFKQHRPHSGRRYVIGHLWSLGYCIQCSRVEQSLQQIDGLGQELRCHQQIVHWEYQVPRSNYLWHIDGHHKLIAWGVVIHGIIDGFCRTVKLFWLPTVLGWWRAGYRLESK